MQFFTSDTHFSHSKIIEYSNRPFKHKDEMNEALIKNWNSVVSSQDTVYHLGDFAFCRGQELANILNRLQGHIVFLYGNHDRELKKDPGLRDRFTMIRDYLELKIPDQSHPRGTQNIILCHYPMMSWNKMHHGSWMLHGHCHGNLKYPFNAKILDVGSDPMKYFPVSYEQVKQLMKNKGSESLDHHSRDL